MLSKSSVKNACIAVLPKQRDGGVEVFRCLMMFLVVLCHTIGGALEHNKLPLIAITLLGVPGFLAISGWYGIRFTWKKWFSIVALTAYYSVFVYLMTRVGSHYGYCKGPNALRLAGGWFMGPYLALMLLAPILNAGLEALLAKGRQTLLLVGGGGDISRIFQLDFLYSRCRPFSYACCRDGAENGDGTNRNLYRA